MRTLHEVGAVRDVDIDVSLVPEDVPVTKSRLPIPRGAMRG